MERVITMVQTIGRDQKPIKPPEGFVEVSSSGTENPHKTLFFEGKWNDEEENAATADRSGHVLGKFETGESMGI